MDKYKIVPCYLASLVPFEAYREYRYIAFDLTTELDSMKPSSP